MTSLGTMFYRLLVVSAFVVFLINGVPNNALGDSTSISAADNGQAHHTTRLDAVNQPRSMTEPAILLLMGSCLAVIAATMRRRTKKA